MSLVDTTNPSTWSGTEGQSLGHAHSYIVLDLDANHDASEFRLEILMHQHRHYLIIDLLLSKSLGILKYLQCLLAGTRLPAI